MNYRTSIMVWGKTSPIEWIAFDKLLDNNELMTIASKIKERYSEADRMEIKYMHNNEEMEYQLVQRLLNLKAFL